MTTEPSAAMERSATAARTSVGLRVERLVAGFQAGSSVVEVVRDVSLEILPNECVALVGESGCGKSVFSLSLVRLLPYPGRTLSGRVWLGDTDALSLPPAQLASIRGRGIAYVFQEPARSLNPVMRIGAQIMEALRLHQPGAATLEMVASLLERVRLPAPALAARRFPHQLSGGQQQRVALAMAMACRPSLLVADEPTTALDATSQWSMLKLLADWRQAAGMSVLLVTHNLAIAAGVCSRINVMYAGQIVESAPARRLVDAPAHPYTRGLLAAAPHIGAGGAKAAGIPGRVPELERLPPGCAFAPRCSVARKLCAVEAPLVAASGEGRTVRCHFPLSEGGHGLA